MTRHLVTRRSSLVNGAEWPPGAWKRLDFVHAHVDPGPSPAGNAGPYLKVPRPDDDTVHRVYCRACVPLAIERADGTAGGWLWVVG